jgi:hypothetical protein
MLCYILQNNNTLTEVEHILQIYSNTVFKHLTVNDTSVDPVP